MRSHADWLAEAEANLKAGDCRAALRALHMAALLKLDEAGILTYQSSATDGRFLRLLRSKGLNDLAAALSSLNHLFVLVWYGNRPAGPQEYAAAQARWRELEALTTP